MSETDQERIARKQAAAPLERRAAANFFIMLGQPAEYDDPEIGKEWAIHMREVIGFLQMTDIEEVKRFLHWALEENAISAKYLRAANDPARTLAKNIESLAKYYRAYAKAQEITERAQRPKDPKLPKYRQESGKNTVLTGDV